MRRIVILILIVLAMISCSFDSNNNDDVAIIKPIDVPIDISEKRKKQSVKLGMTPEKVIEILGTPISIQTSELGTKFDYGKCRIWFDEGIVTNTFCTDIFVTIHMIDQ